MRQSGPSLQRANRGRVCSANWFARGSGRGRRGNVSPQSTRAQRSCTGTERIGGSGERALSYSINSWMRLIQLLIKSYILVSRASWRRHYTESETVSVKSENPKMQNAQYSCNMPPLPLAPLPPCRCRPLGIPMLALWCARPQEYSCTVYSCVC